MSERAERNKPRLELKMDGRTGGGGRLKGG